MTQSHHLISHTWWFCYGLGVQLSIELADWHLLMILLLTEVAG